MKKLFLKSDTDIEYETPRVIVNSASTALSTGTCTAVVKDSAGDSVGSSVTMTYDSTLDEWRGTFEDPWVDDNGAADALVEDAEYTIEITLTGSGDFAGADDFRSVEAIGYLRGDA